MRVAIVALYPLDSAHMMGGMRVAVYNLVQGLAALTDLDIHVIYCHAEVLRDHVAQQGRVTVHYLALPRRRLLPGYMRSLMRISACLKEIKPDVVNGHTSHFAIPSLRAGLPTVLTLHGVAHREAAIYNQTLYDRLRFGMAKVYDRYTLPRVQDIIVISPYVMREYAGRMPAHWHRIDNPLPEEYFHLERHEEPGRVLYAGTITPLKDVLTLLRAFAVVHTNLPGAHLRLAGSAADADYVAELRQFIAANGLTDSVEFLGLLDTPGMMREYAACALTVLPSRQEVQPMTVIESMAAGVPVVVTRAGGLSDLVSDGVTGLVVDVGDHNAMAAAITRLLQDSNERRRMGAQGRLIAQSRFRAAAVAERYREVYQEVVARANEK